MASYTGIKSGKVAGIGDKLNVSFLAGIDSDITLDSGKVIAKFKATYRATEAETASAQTVWGKLKEPEKTELREFFKPQIEKWQANKKLKNQLFNEYTTGRGGRSGNYR